MLRMRKKDRQDNLRERDPGQIFRATFAEEQCKGNSKTLKIEKLPIHGGMNGYFVRYFSANRIWDINKLICEEFGPGRYFLTFADDNFQTLDECGHLWLDVGDPQEIHHYLECIGCEVDGVRNDLRKLQSKSGMAYSNRQIMTDVAECALNGFQAISDFLENKSGKKYQL